MNGTLCKFLWAWVVYIAAAVNNFPEALEAQADFVGNQMQKGYSMRKSTILIFS